jgi:gas vesicle structural protein
MKRTRGADGKRDRPSGAAHRRRPRPPGPLALQRRVSLCETLDRVLDRGAVVAGDIVISVADVDLLYIGLDLVVASIETMRRDRR